MKFFLDTAQIDEIKEAAAYGMLDGVTTNPSLVAKAGLPYEQIIRDICEVCKGPISAEVLGTSYDEMLKEARQWASLSSQVVVKIPLTIEGLKVVSSCTAEGIRTNVTLCFSAVQALMAAKAGASYISPFVGRLDDCGQHGMELISEIKKIYNNYKLPTEVLVASIRSPLHLKDAAKLGADVATIPFKVLSQIVKHPLTDKGLAAFLEDAKSIPQA
ncbi:MAG: fructose-6-phosphate aldolase [Oligoflexales bacterium]|nr:fructose-6-phosphate aldolase [Oligoflexales bacterium]